MLDPNYECFSAYFIDRRTHRNTFIPRMDRPAELGASAEDILRLARGRARSMRGPTGRIFAQIFETLFPQRFRLGAGNLCDSHGFEERYLVTEFITHPDIARTIGTRSTLYG